MEADARAGEVVRVKAADAAWGMDVMTTVAVECMNIKAVNVEEAYGVLEAVAGDVKADAVYTREVGADQAQEWNEQEWQEWNEQNELLAELAQAELAQADEEVRKTQQVLAESRLAYQAAGVARLISRGWLIRPLE